MAAVETNMTASRFQAVPPTPANVMSPTDREDETPMMMRRKTSKKMPTSDKEVFVEEEDDEKINFDRLSEFVGEMHPRKKDKSDYTCADMCTYKTGYHYCGRTTKNTDIDRFGIGITLYFRFMKYIAAYFLVFAIISIPALFFCIRAQMTSFDPTWDNSYLSLLAATSVGAIGIDSYACHNFKGSQLTENGGKTNFTVSCSSGVISTKNFYYSYADNSSSCYYMTSQSVNVTCNNYASPTLNASQDACKGKTSCNFQMDDSFFEGNHTAGCSVQPWSNIIVRFYCEGASIDLGAGHLEKKWVALIMGVLDAFTVLLYCFMLFQLRYSERKTKDYVLNHSLNPSLFSIEVQNLPEKMEPEKLKVLLKDYFEKQARKEGAEAYVEGAPSLEVADVQLAESHSVLKLLVSRYDLRDKRDVRVREFIKKFDPKKTHFTGTIVKVADLGSILPTLSANAREQRNAESEIREIQEMSAEIDKLTNQLELEKNQPKKKIFGAFITYESMETRNYVLKNFKRTPVKEFCLRRCKCCGCGAEKDYFYGQRLEISPAPDPTTIRWQNLDVRCLFLRRFLSLIASVILLVISFVVIVTIKIEQEAYVGLAPPVVCEGSMTEISEANRVKVVNSMKNGKSAADNTALECFCRELLGDGENLITYEFPDGKTYCSDWLEYKSLAIALPLAMAACIVVINILCQLVFNLLSNFEKHRNVASEAFSRMLKTFIIQFLNTALVLLIVNADFGNSNSLFQGKYSDFTPYWYKTVGATLLSTVIINVLSMPFVELMTWLVTKFMQFWDRGCKCSGNFTRQTRQRDLQEMYMGPAFLIEYRYASILTILAVCMMYSAGLPLFFLIASLYMFITYWIDKFFLLRLYRLPPNFDEYLETLVRRIAYIPAILHILIAVWVYGNSDIFEEEIFENISDFTSSQLDTWGVSLPYKTNYASSFFSRIQYSQNIVLIIVLLLVLVIIILRWLVKGLLGAIFGLCCKRCHQLALPPISSDVSKIPYSKLLRDKNLNMDEKVLKKERFTSKDPDYQKFLEGKLDRTSRTLKERESGMGVSMSQKYRFQSGFSYNIRNNLEYHDIYLDEYQ